MVLNFTKEMAMSDVSNTTNVTTVDVQSAWASKINWTQVVAGLAMVLAWLSGGKIGLTMDQQLALVTVIGLISNVVTWVLKTWFTKTVTPASITGVPGGLPKVILPMLLMIGVAVALSACSSAQVANFKAGVGAITGQGISNPITPATLYETENVVTVAVAGLNGYKRACVAQTIAQSCRAIIKSLQVYTRKMAAALPDLRGFVRSNDQVNAGAVYNIIMSLYSDFKAQAPAGVVPN